MGFLIEEFLLKEVYGWVVIGGYLFCCDLMFEVRIGYLLF